MKIVKNICALTLLVCAVNVTISNLNNSKHGQPLVNIDNVEALARGESTNECEGCLSSLYFCRIYGDWGGCLGTETIFNV